jgi:hypothetical protein
VRKAKAADVSNRHRMLARFGGLARLAPRTSCRYPTLLRTVERLTPRGDPTSRPGRRSSARPRRRSGRERVRSVRRRVLESGAAAAAAVSSGRDGIESMFGGARRGGGLVGRERGGGARRRGRKRGGVAAGSAARTWADQMVARFRNDAAVVDQADSAPVPRGPRLKSLRRFRP